MKDGESNVLPAALEASGKSRIYILDTGIYAESGDFCGRVKPGWTAGDASFAGSPWWPGGIIPPGADTSHCSSMMDHGTHVASCAGGFLFGIARKVEIVSVQVLDCSGGASMEVCDAAIEVHPCALDGGAGTRC